MALERVEYEECQVIAFRPFVQLSERGTHDGARRFSRASSIFVAVG